MDDDSVGEGRITDVGLLVRVFDILFFLAAFNGEMATVDGGADIKDGDDDTDADEDDTLGLLLYDFNSGDEIIASAYIFLAAISSINPI